MWVVHGDGEAVGMFGQTQSERVWSVWSTILNERDRRTEVNRL